MTHVHLRWLKDFIAVAETGSFSRAADNRAITQPAMSRHIKSLEEWVGVVLLDRTTFPAQLTPAGESFLALARETVSRLENGVGELRQLYRIDSQVIRFAMQHALASEFFSEWWTSLSINQTRNPVVVKVDAMNLHDCIERMVTGHCQFLICYQYPDAPVLLDQTLYSQIKIGHDTIVPVSALSAGRVKFNLSDKRVPYVGSAPDEFMGTIVSSIIHRQQGQKKFYRIYEDSVSAGVKAQALAGQGIAWLPKMLVNQELKNGTLKIVGESAWQESLDIVLQRRVEAQFDLVDKVWDSMR
ncbi:MAG: LysR family transcriptional regulator [Pseudomonadota bacterium]